MDFGGVSLTCSVNNVRWCAATFMIRSPAFRKCGWCAVPEWLNYLNCWRLKLETGMMHRLRCSFP